MFLLCALVLLAVCAQCSSAMSSSHDHSRNDGSFALRTGAAPNGVVDSETWTEAVSTHVGRSAAATAATVKHVAQGSLRIRDTAGKASTSAWSSDKSEIKFFSRIFVGLCMSLLLIGIPIFVAQHVAYKQVPKREKRFGDFLWYRFSFWFASNPGAHGLLLFLLTLSIIVSGALLLWAGKDEPLYKGLWLSWLWVCAPDGGSTEVDLTGRSIAVIINICGLIIFALLVSMITDNFTSWMTSLKSGADPIIEGQHVVIVGWTDKTAVIIGLMDHQNRGNGIQTVAILAEQDKEEVEQAVVDADLALQNSVVVVRSGKGYLQGDLGLVSAESARVVVVLSDSSHGSEAADANAIRTLLCLRGRKWPQEGRITAQCASASNVALMQQLLGDRGSVVSVGDVTARLMVQATRYWGIPKVFYDIIGFGPRRFKCMGSKKLEGRTFGELIWLCKKAVPLGIRRADGTSILAPEADAVMKAGDELIVVTGETHLHVSKKQRFNPDSFFAAHPINQALATARSVTKVPERNLVLGWNPRASMLLSELDRKNVHGSEVVVVSPTETTTRLESLEEVADFQHVTVTHIEDHCGSYERLQDVFKEPVDNVFCLAEASHDDPDGTTIASLIMVQALESQQKEAGGRSIVIVPEILSSNTESLLGAIHMTEYVDAIRFVGGVIALMAEDQRLDGVVSLLLSSTGPDLHLRGLKSYVEDDVTEVSFWELQALVRAASESDIAVGYIHEGMCELDPQDKDTKVEWTLESKIIVLCRPGM